MTGDELLRSINAQIDAHFAVEPPPVDPPPPPPPPPVTAVFRQIGDGAVRGLKPKTPNLPALLKFHGTGNSDVTSNAWGDLYEYHWDAGLANHPDARLYGQFTVYESNGLIRIDPTDHVKHPVTGKIVWTWWLGIEENGVINRFTESRMDAILAFCVERYQIDQRRVRLIGSSMGAGGALTYGLRRYGKFNSIHPALPNWNFGRIGSLGPVSDYARPKPVTWPDGTDFWPTVNMLAFLDNPENRTPWLQWHVGRNDPNMPWPQQLEAIRLCRLHRRAFAVAWNNGGHSEGNIAGTPLNEDYLLQLFATDQSHPAFFNSSIDQDPVNDPAGQINVGFAWRSVEDFHDHWSCEIRNKRADGDMTVEVLPYNRQHAVFAVAPKTISIPHGQWVKVEWRADEEETPPPEEPEPPVEPPPPPPPAEPTVASIEVVHRVPVYGRRMLMLSITHTGGSTYERYQLLTPFLSAATPVVKFASRVLGAAQPLLQSTYELWIDGARHSSASLPAGAKGGSLPFDALAYAQGEHKVEVRGHPLEVPVPEMLFIDRGRPIVQDCMYVTTGTRDFRDTDRPDHIILKVTPPEFHPKTVPLPEREFPHFAEALPYSKLYRFDISPFRSNHIHRPSRHDSGLISTRNRDGYDPEFAEPSLHPRMHVVDGPRGRGTVTQVLHMDFGRRGGIYFMDDWGFRHIDATGEVKTLFGNLHAGDMPSQWQGEQKMVLRGDWSRIPEERQIVEESWKWRWIKRTLAVDLNAPQSEWVNGEPPHVVGPEMLCVDALGRTLKATFHRSIRNTPPIITEFITGLADPWSFDIDEDAGIIYISERALHRISKWDLNTGAFLGVLIQGDNMIQLIGKDRFFHKSLPVDHYRAGRCVGPEEVNLWDGALEFGSAVMAQIVRVNLATGEPTPILNLSGLEKLDGYVKFSHSDGTFGPRGTRFVSMWKNTNLGHPQAYLPDGSIWKYAGGETTGYTTTHCVGNGRMAFSPSEEGLVGYGRRLPTDSVRDLAKYARGRKEWHVSGHYKEHGPAGWSYWNATPKGLSDDERYYLSENGTG